MKPSHYMGDLIARDFLKWPNLERMAMSYVASAGEDFAICPAEMVDYLRTTAAEIVEEDDLDDQDALAEWLKRQA